MNARQKAKKYKKIAEANQKDAEAWRRHVFAENLKKANEKKMDLIPFTCHYLISAEEVKFIGEQSAEDKAKYMIMNNMCELIRDKIKISTYDRGCGVEYWTSLYIGIKEV